MADKMDKSTRLATEREFHDERERLRREARDAHDAVYVNRRFYKITGKSQEFVNRWLRRRAPGSRALDFCCGTGGNSIRLAKMGAHVTGIDISEQSVETAKEKALASNLGHHARFFVMDAEKTQFDDGVFDLVICDGVLHHLELRSAYRELARILKDDGEIICIEALGHNPVINWYRRRTPHLRTPWEIDHILRLEDIDAALQYFARTEKRYFHLAAIAAIPLIGKPGFGSLLRVFNAIDDLILRDSLIGRFAWQVVFTLSDPRREVTPPH